MRAGVITRDLTLFSMDGKELRSREKNVLAKDAEPVTGRAGPGTLGALSL